MTVELYNRLQAGGSNISWIFHVGGFPYALASDQRVINALILDTANRRTMFGKAHHGANYPADDIPIFNALQGDSLGSQTISICDEKCELEGGSWSVNIARTEPGYSWTHRDGDIYGFEGIHTQPNPDYDDSIACARLASQVSRSSTTLKITNEIGEKIKDAVTALGANEYVYLWIGTECIAVNGYEVIDGEIILTIRMRGVYRTCVQEYFVDDPEAPTIRVANAPIYGAQNRPAFLWAVPMSDGGTAIDGNPVLFRQGKVSPRIETRQGLTKVNCTSWWEQLKTPVRMGKPGNLTGYFFSRVVAAADDKFLEYDRAPAMLLWEEDLSPAQTWNAPKKIYLCPQSDPPVEGETTHKTFFSMSDLISAINSELAECKTTAIGSTTANGSDGTSKRYVVDAGMMYSLEDTDDFAYVAGFLPWLLNLGYIERGDVEDARMLFSRNEQWFTSYAEEVDHSNTKDVGDYDFLPAFMRLVLSKRMMEDPDDRVLKRYYVPRAAEAEQMIAKYAYQYQWEPDNAGSKTPLARWPVPTKENNPECRFYLDINILNAQYFADVDLFHIGNLAVKFDGVPMSYKGGIDSLGAGTAINNNYIVVDNTYRQKAFGSLYNAIKYTNGSHGPLRRGDFLTYIPFWHGEEDPWTIGGIVHCKPDGKKCHPLISIFRGLLGGSGNTAFGDFAPHAKTLHVPGAVSDLLYNNDFPVVIDWDGLNELLDEIDLPIDTELTLNSDMNFYDLFFAELHLYGVTPTWFFDNAKYLWCMGFRQVGIVDATAALLNGRVIDRGNRTLYTAPRGEFHSVERLIDTIEIKLNWNQEEEKHLRNFNVIDRSFDPLLTKTGKKIKVESYCSHVSSSQDEGELANYLVALLRRLGTPVSEIEIDQSIDPAVSLAIGESLQITDATVRHPYNGRLGLTGEGALCSGVTVDLSKGRVKTKVRMSPYAVYGWAPSLYAPTERHEEVDATKIDVTLTAAEDNVFTPTGGRIDLSYFDCFNWNKSTRVYTARDCNCVDYVVHMFEKDNDNPTVFEFSLSFFDGTLDSGSANYRKFRLTGAHVGYNPASNYIVEFPKWSTMILQNCQRAYIYAADKDGELTDEFVAKTRGRIWG